MLKLIFCQKIKNVTRFYVWQVKRLKHYSISNRTLLNRIYNYGHEKKLSCFVDHRKLLDN